MRFRETNYRVLKKIKIKISKGTIETKELTSIK